MNVIKQLWRDEEGFVVSAELVLVASVAVLAMIVGLATYRDAIIDELGDSAHAVNALDQSYAVEIGDSANTDATMGPVIDESGGVVTVTREYSFAMGGTVVDVTATFNNFSYTDAPDFCEACTVTRTSAAGANENSAGVNPAP